MTDTKSNKQHKYLLTMGRELTETELNQLRSIADDVCELENTSVIDQVHHSPPNPCQEEE